MTLPEIIKALGELARAGAKNEEIEAAFQADPDALKVWNMIKGLGESAQWNKIKSRLTTAEDAVKDLTKERDEIAEKLKAKETESPDDAAAPYRKKADELAASLEEMRAELRARDVAAEWNEVLSLVEGAEGDPFRVNKDYFDVLKTRFGSSINFPKGKKAIEYLKEGAALTDLDGKSGRAQLAEWLRDQVPAGFRVVNSAPGGGINQGGGGGTPDADLFKTMRDSGAAAGKAAASSDGMRKLAGIIPQV